MSLKGESVLENRISELKQDGQGMVAKVLENHSYLDVERWPAGHMTCTWIGPGDYPWEGVGGGGMVGGTPSSSRDSSEEVAADGEDGDGMSVADSQARGDGGDMDLGEVGIRWC